MTNRAGQADALHPPLPSPEGRCVDADSLSFANRPEAGTDLSSYVAGREHLVPGPRGNPLLKILCCLINSPHCPATGVSPRRSCTS
jgi:hypothetical protein